jgi:hypothetical protein
MRYLVNRLNTYPVSNEIKNRTEHRENTLCNNKYNIKNAIKHPTPQKLNTDGCPQHQTEKLNGPLSDIKKEQEKSQNYSRAFK